MTVNAARRYEEASSRNVRNVTNVIHGVNKGAEDPKLTAVARLKFSKYTLADAKIHAGVKASDSRYDTQLQALLDKTAPAKPKKEKEEGPKPKLGELLSPKPAKVLQDLSPAADRAIPTAIAAEANPAKAPTEGFSLPVARKPTKKIKQA